MYHTWILTKTEHLYQGQHHKIKDTVQFDFNPVFFQVTKTAGWQKFTPF